jgi:signal transduction histidine kinase
MLRQHSSIRRKLMTLLLLTSGAAVALTALSYCAYEFLTFRRTMTAQIALLGEVIGSNSTAALAFNSVEDAEQILSGLRAEKHIVAAALYTSQGGLFARYPSALPPDRLPAAVQNDGHRYTDAGLESFQPVLRDGRRLGTLYLRSDLGALAERMRLFLAMGLAVVAASFAVAYLVARVLQHQISRPIVALEATARAISEGRDYAVRAAKESEDEIGRLTDAFNHMLDQIQQLNRELEQRVRERTAELQIANEELEAFSYSVSHDLRAPLRHVGGFATMLQAHAGTALDDKGRRYVTVIQESARRMGQLIDDLLAFSRQSRVELRREAVALDELLRQVQQNLLSEQAGRRIRWEVAPLPVVTGDAALLRQVFANIMGNAVKYTRQREEARIEIGAQPAAPGETVVFVRDNGAGFDMKYIDKLFGVFQRLHTDDAFEGTGVGLATVRRIVQRHGGRVWAEAKVQAGATFFVALPVATSSNGTTATSNSSPSA